MNKGPSGRGIDAIVDTGAARTVFNVRDAKELGIRKSNKETKVVGVGQTRGNYTEPTQLTVLNKILTVEGLILHNDNVPTLLGMEELKRLGKLFDLQTGEFIDTPSSENSVYLNVIDTNDEHISDNVDESL